MYLIGGESVRTSQFDLFQFSCITIVTFKYIIPFKCRQIHDAEPLLVVVRWFRIKLIRLLVYVVAGVLGVFFTCLLCTMCLLGCLFRVFLWA